MTTPDESDLRSALNGGGTVTFACSGTIAISNTIAIANDTTLDGSGENITISGGSAVQLFTVATNVAFGLKSLTLANGLALGTNGAVDQNGGPGKGGAICDNGGTVFALYCSFVNNVAQGGVGGNLSLASVTYGGVGSGGAILCNAGNLAATNCTFTLNKSAGGDGYSGSGVLSWGGDAQGGAICNQGGTVRLVNCLVSSNQTIGGLGKKFTALGTGGTTYGGAIFTAAGDTSIMGCKVSLNSDISGIFGAAYGGSVCQNGGTLLIIDSIFNTNTAVGGGALNEYPAAAALGGALAINAGSAWVTNSTFSGNVAAGLDGVWSGAAYGGAVFNAGSLQTVNCTIEGNTAQSGSTYAYSDYPGQCAGGGFCNQGGSMSLDYSTIFGNRAKWVNLSTPPGTNLMCAGVFSTNGVTTIHACILASNLNGGNGLGNLKDAGYNLSDDASCHFTNTGSMNKVNPHLGPLGNYGGATPTMALLAGSPAIDGGDPLSYPATDQRGHARPFGSAPDIGAFESSPPYEIRGQVSGATLRDEVLVTAASVANSTTNHGSYTFLGLNTGTYSVTPKSSNYLFLPASRSITVGPDQLHVDFKAYRWNALSLDAVTNHTLHLVFAGTNGVTWRLLTSTNLVQWSPALTNTIGPGNYWEMFLPVNGSQSQFFRMASP